ncbi:MAG: hypothetical protein U0797_10410 [Gemmataceae bacterium]
MGLLLSDDLIYTSKVTGTAKALGLTVTPARTPAALLELARKAPPACVIVDLQHPQLDLPGLLKQLREVCPVMPRVVGYGSHVEAEALRAAREAGCNPAWPRSKFAEELPASLPGWLAGP